METDKRVLYDHPIDSQYNLVLTATYTDHGGYCCSTSLQIDLRDSKNKARQWELGTLNDESESVFSVERLSPSEVVLCRKDPDYGMEGNCTKLFLNLNERRLLSTIDFEWTPVSFGDEATAQRVLGVSVSDWQTLRARGVFETTDDSSLEPPEAFTTHPLPQTSQAEFAKARPNDQAYEIQEKPWGWQPDRGGYWFGKMFYDGEGMSGVGDVGFLDRNGRYQWLHIAEMAEWSTRSLLVEPSTILAGLTCTPEGATFPGGLLEYDRTTRRARIHDIKDIIHAIARTGNALFLGTTHGLYVMRDSVTIRYRMEPDEKGIGVVVSERIK